MVYENDFVYGKRTVKKAVAAAVVCCVATLVTQNNSSLYMLFFALTVAAFIAAILIVFKYCRCPHCGKVIFLGVLSVTTCSRCKRNLVTGKKVKKSKR